jgi:hypothetical protein
MEFRPKKEKWKKGKIENPLSWVGSLARPAPPPTAWSPERPSFPPSPARPAPRVPHARRARRRLRRRRLWWGPLSCPPKPPPSLSSTSRASSPSLVQLAPLPHLAHGYRSAAVHRRPSKVNPSPPPPSLLPRPWCGAPFSRHGVRPARPWPRHGLGPASWCARAPHRPHPPMVWPGAVHAAPCPRPVRLTTSAPARTPGAPAPDSAPLCARATPPSPRSGAPAWSWRATSASCPRPARPRPLPLPLPCTVHPRPWRVAPARAPASLGRHEAPAPVCPLVAMVPGAARAMPRCGSSCPHGAAVAPDAVCAVPTRRGRGALAARAASSALVRLVRGASVRPHAR